MFWRRKPPESYAACLRTASKQALPVRMASSSYAVCRLALQRRCTARWPGTCFSASAPTPSATAPATSPMSNVSLGVIPEETLLPSIPPLILRFTSFLSATGVRASASDRSCCLDLHVLRDSEVSVHILRFFLSNCKIGLLSMPSTASDPFC
jgi:hypothetical protein